MCNQHFCHFCCDEQHCNLLFISENSRSSKNGCSTMAENDLDMIVFGSTVMLVFIFRQMILLGLIDYAIKHGRYQNTSICISVLNEFCCCKQKSRKELAENLQNISTPVHVVTIQCTVSSTTTSTKFQSTSDILRSQVNSEEKVKIILRKTFVSGVISMLSDVLIGFLFSI